MTKPVVLVLIDHYLPGFRMGGPLRSILSLIEHLGGEFDFRIVTSDRDLSDDVSYSSVEIDRWNQVGPVSVFYASPRRQGLMRIAELIENTPHDLLYLNSCFSPRFTIAPLVGRRLRLFRRRPVLIAPRGELSPAALSIKSAKKKAWISFARATGIYTGLHWQASSENDVHLIGNILGAPPQSIQVAACLPASLPSDVPQPASRAPNAPLRIAFLSRISPMKNLDYALRVLGMVRVPVSFSIYGPPEDPAYAAQCRKLAVALPPHVAVRWHGPVDPAEVAGTLAKYDLFFLPTRGENFGHVIAEALGAGTPVLISDATPWRGLAAAGVGDDLPLEAPGAFAAVIEAAAVSPPERVSARRTRAFQFAAARQRDGTDIAANRLLFRTALAQPPMTNSSEYT